MEKVIVRVFCVGRKMSESTFTNYDKALTYAHKQVSLGYSCLILRKLDEKIWSKIWLNSSETC